MFSKIIASVTALITLTSCRSTVSPEIDNFDLPLKIDTTNLSHFQKTGFSKRAAKLGWDSFYAKDYDTASRRFNQAWILNNQNYKALWGMGVLMGQRAMAKDFKLNIKESIRFLEMSYKIQPKNARLNADLAQAHTLYGKMLKEGQKDIVKHVENLNDSYKSHFDKAEKLFIDSYERNGYDIKMLVDFADFCIEIKDYKLAKRLIIEAEKEGCSYPDSYLKKLDRLIKTSK